MSYLVSRCRTDINHTLCLNYHRYYELPRITVQPLKRQSNGGLLNQLLLLADAQQQLIIHASFTNLLAASHYTDSMLTKLWALHGE